MEERKNIFDFMGHVFMQFGISMILLCVICRLFGEDAKEISTMFRMGREGIGLDTMCQFFLITVLITLTRTAFFTDVLLKNASVVVRTAGMLCSVVVLVAVFSVIFGWFPVNMWEPWAMFFLCLCVCFAVSMGVVYCKERLENRRMEEALKNMQRKLEETQKNKGL